jgi:hypothetical protein
MEELKDTNVPDGVRGWNWGAFFLGWIWGIGNGVWIALLALIPGFGLIMHIVLGLKGNEWAWQSRSWQSLQEFRKVQRTWTLWGVTVIVGLCVLVLGIDLMVSRITDPLFPTARVGRTSTLRDRPLSSLRIHEPGFGEKNEPAKHR